MKLKFTNAKPIKLLYQLMRDVDMILNRNNIPYWVCGGTFLGAVRHSGIIPWDDDLDICMDRKYNKQLESISSVFKKYGYKLIHNKIGYKICYSNIHNLRGFDYSFPNLDIFTMKLSGDKNSSGKESLYVPNVAFVRKTWPKEYYNLEDLYPLTSYKFGDFWVLGPNNYKTYFDRMYGNNWNKVAYREYDHEKEEEVEKVLVKLTDSDRKPAMPISTKLKKYTQFNLQEKLIVSVNLTNLRDIIQFLKTLNNSSIGYGNIHKIYINTNKPVCPTSFENIKFVNYKNLQFPKEYNKLDYIDEIIDINKSRNTIMLFVKSKSFNTFSLEKMLSKIRCDPIEYEDGIYIE